ncbi:unnamed protein product [Boreogadus saida]
MWSMGLGGKDTRTGHEKTRRGREEERTDASAERAASDTGVVLPGATPSHQRSKDCGVRLEKMTSEGLQLWIVVLALGSVAVHGYPSKITVKERVDASAAQVALGRSGGDRQPTLEELQGENLLQTLPPASSSREGRWSKHRLQGLLPQPAPEEEPQPFILDLRNFPDLANADLGAQNPNIQVTIEVVDGPQREAEVEMEMDLVKDGQRNDWSASSEMPEGHRKLFWPLFWEYPDPAEEGATGPAAEPTGRDYGQDPEEPALSGVGGDWGSRWNKGWDIKDNSEYEEEWSHWAPCSVSCGQGTQKRLRSCGYACTATESRTCDLDGCRDDMDAVSSPTPPQTTNSTDALDTNVDSCEKWLSCKNDFLRQYLHQVLTELPSCPCAYPSEAVYSAVHLADPRLRHTYRWRDASGPKERLDIYKPSARFCLRSMLSYDSTTLAAQHCCYDEQMRLLTRGKGAGAPNLISTEFSPELHHKVDVLPWILCKGDWSLFHSVRPPNNGLACAHNPGDEVYRDELREAREY